MSDVTLMMFFSFPDGEDSVPTSACLNIEIYL
jgi:hypothetical protein